MLEFDVLQSGLVILLLLALGDVLTHFTRGAVPAVLFAGLAYMLCCWAGVLPEDLLEKIVEGVKAKLSLDKAGDLLGSLKKLF